MNQELIEKLQYSSFNENVTYSLPSTLKASLNIISYFFKNNKTNKLCLVFPSRDYSAQWLSVPTVLLLIESDYYQYYNEIFESHRGYKKGDKLLLNGDAIVEWEGINKQSVSFKAGKEPNSALFTIDKTQSIKLQKTNQSRQLSSLKRVKNALPGKITTPTDKLLKINTYGNVEFIKNRICLVSKLKTYEDSIANITLNLIPLTKYFRGIMIDENGETDTISPLLIAKDFSNLALYITQYSNSVSRIIIDGFNNIQDRGTDFSDIDAKNIPTILISDLSEIDNFATIAKFGFEFFNFTIENLQVEHYSKSSPFQVFTNKLNKYISFHIVKESCQNRELEILVQKIHSIETDDSNYELTNLKISLIQLINSLSKVANILTIEESSFYNNKINRIEFLFLQSRMWLGNSIKPIEESISLLKSVIDNFSTNPSEKCIRISKLIESNFYDYIICATDEEVLSIERLIASYHQKPRVITITDVNDSLLSCEPQRAILTGWVKVNNINRLLSSFVFAELTVLFYEFENKYFSSLQRRNQQLNKYIRSTINDNGFYSETELSKGFWDLISGDETATVRNEGLVDVSDLEFNIDNAQYSKYRGKGNLSEKIKAKRINAGNDFLIYSTESHKFLVVTELNVKQKNNVIIQRKKLDLLKPGDIVAIINTERDILAELVEKYTDKSDLSCIRQWTDLWKTLLKEYFASIGSNFKQLVYDLREHGCNKHEVTIKTWLQDENRIGPDDNADLISIALMTDSKLLYDNIGNVRDAIGKMTGWRMKASDYISDKIKSRIHEFTDSYLIDTNITVEGLGSVMFLKVTEISNIWENIDVRYVNRLLQKDVI
ncbi:MAG: DrmE family protein [Clostridiales bacterium]